MATPREIFEKDMSGNLSVHAAQQLRDGGGNIVAEPIARVCLDFIAGVKFIALFIDAGDWTVHIISHYVRNPGDALKASEGIESISGFYGTPEQVSSASLKFSRRVLAYTTTTLSAEQHAMLQQLATEHGIALLLRDGAYLAQRIFMQAPLAFISHDSRDKETFVRELATTLQRMTCTVWYDEFSLVPGQSLRESIENGLKKCKKCVLVLSPYFIANGGWTKAEFDSIFTREVLEQKNVVIPIWHGVTKQQVYDYSPRLLDRVALNSSLGVEDVAKKLFAVIMKE